MDSLCLTTSYLTTTVMRPFDKSYLPSKATSSRFARGNWNRVWIAMNFDWLSCWPELCLPGWVSEFLPTNGGGVLWLEQRWVCSRMYDRSKKKATQQIPALEQRNIDSPEYIHRNRFQQQYSLPGKRWLHQIALVQGTDRQVSIHIFCPFSVYSSFYHHC